MKWNWGKGVIALYGGFVLLMGLMVVVATRHDVDLVAPDYYERELRYEDRIQKTKRGALTPVQWSLSDRVVTVTFSEPVASGSLQAYRPSDSRMDFRIPVNTGPDRKQTISLKGKPAGLWKFMAEWNANGESFYAEKRFYVE